MANKFVLGGELIEHLAPLIGVGDGSNVRKIIIVASYNDVTEIHVEMLAVKTPLKYGIDMSLLNLEATHLEHAKIKIIGDDDGGG